VRPALHVAILSLSLGGIGCGPRTPAVDLIFVDGRATAPAGDTLLGITASGLQGLVILDRRTGAVDTIGEQQLVSPYHVQALDNKWYVSDMENGDAVVIRMDADGRVERRISLSGLASVPHQFAVLPDGGIVVESSDGKLLSVTEDGAETFALVERGRRTGLLVAARGGVLHAVSGRFITLYNAQGRIRWRLNWLWRETAFVSDLAVDARGRVYFIAGEEGRDGFVVFSLSPLNGEVVSWSEFGPYATFVVDKIGTISPDSADTWLGG
jgi:hypothetical protein